VPNGLVVAVAAIVGIALGYFMGRSRGATPGGSTSVSGSGGGPETGSEDDAVRELAFRTALRRMHTFLESNVDAPLRGALDGARPLPVAVEQARAAIQDLELFLEDPAGETASENMTDLVRSTAHEFTEEWDAAIRIGAPETPVRVMAAADDFSSALFLVLHNAARFADGRPVTVEVKREDGWGRVLVKDSGPGFSAEALSRAYDPFYSTTKSGLGMGLSHARRAVEAQGGKIHLRNAQGGGAEVEIALPLA